MMINNDTVDVITMYSSLLLAGLAASLHCIGMCGPILLGFAEVFERTALTVNKRPVAVDRSGQQHRSLIWDFSCYQVGRIWTYGMLGFIAGWLGQGIRDSGNYLGMQFSLAIAVSVGVIVSGVMLLGIVPFRKVDQWLSGCGAGRLSKKKWFVSLTRHQGGIARLLLGVVMGLLPCGMVYAVLLIVVTLPTPLHSALGMVIFGLGTLPSLTGVLLAHRVLPARFRAHGTRLVAVMVIMAGAWMMARTFIVLPSSGQDIVHASCHHE